MTKSNINKYSPLFFCLPIYSFYIKRKLVAVFIYIYSADTFMQSNKYSKRFRDNKHEKCISKDIVQNTH